MKIGAFGNHLLGAGSRHERDPIFFPTFLVLFASVLCFALLCPLLLLMF